MKEKKPPISLKAVRKVCSLPGNKASVAWWDDTLHVWWYKPLSIEAAQGRLNKLLDDKDVHDGRCPYALSPKPGARPALTVDDVYTPPKHILE